MRKQRLFPLLAVLLLAMGLASAQLSSQSVKADIPFEFMAGNRSMSAGEYRVAAISPLGAISMIGASDKTLVNSHSVQAAAPLASTKLIFHRYGNRYFLYQVWVQGENLGREFPQTKLEKELASNASLNIVAVLAHP